MKFRSDIFLFIIAILMYCDLAYGKARVTVTTFLPNTAECHPPCATPDSAARANPMPAVIICPGGSYFWLDAEGEGAEVARWLNSKGIAAFVLNYHVAGKFTFGTDFRFLWGGCSFPEVLNDTQSALRHVRDIAGQAGINPSMVGLMGFSAGGHLAMLTEELSQEKPDFVACIYPVVTLSDKRCVHKRSRRGLLGAKVSSHKYRDSLSLEKHVPENCCPVFLVGCLDDNTVNPLNFALLDSALSANHIPHENHIFPCGGHGFGCQAITECDTVYDWKPLFIDWLNGLGFPDSGNQNE